MIRAQLYLPKGLYEDIKRSAQAENQSAAELMREILKTGVQERRASRPGGGLSSLAKLGVRGGPKDLATNLDYYMYGPGHSN